MSDWCHLASDRMSVMTAMSDQKLTAPEEGVGSCLRFCKEASLLYVRQGSFLQKLAEAGLLETT
jgi:hypothetical protein